MESMTDQSILLLDLLSIFGCEYSETKDVPVCFIMLSVSEASHPFVMLNAVKHL